MQTLKAFVLVLTLLPAAAGGFSATGSIQVTTPQRLSLSLGAFGADGSLLGPSAGVLARIEPGISGGKLHLGFRSAFSLLFLPVTSIDITGALLQTWFDPWGGVESGQTYLGGELRIGIRAVVATAGLYRHAAGDGEDGLTGSFGLGIGL